MTGQGKIRQYDSKINAISRLIDSAIIFLTFISVLAVSHVEWTGAYLPIVFSAIILFSFFAFLRRLIIFNC